jgi:hypothetical protein
VLAAAVVGSPRDTTQYIHHSPSSTPAASNNLSSNSNILAATLHSPEPTPFYPQCQ